MSSLLWALRLELSRVRFNVSLDALYTSFCVLSRQQLAFLFICRAIDVIPRAWVDANTAQHQQSATISEADFCQRQLWIKGG